MARRVMPQRTNGSNGAHMKQGFAIILPACCARAASGHDAAAPAVIDADVLADGPTRLLETLRKRREAGLSFRIVRRKGHQHADAPHALARLRARSERPRRRSTAEQRDELAALCMSGKQHSEGRRGFGHDRLPVATGSPQALRIPNRE